MNKFYQNLIDNTYMRLGVLNQYKSSANWLVNEFHYWCDLNANATDAYDRRLYLCVFYNIIEDNFDYIVNNYKSWEKFLRVAYFKGKTFIAKLKDTNESPNVDFDNFVASKIYKINKMIVDKCIKEHRLEFIETDEMLEFITSILGDFVKEKKEYETFKSNHELFVKTRSSNGFIKFNEAETANDDEPMLIPESDCDSIAESCSNTRPRRNVKRVNYKGMCK